LSKLEEKYEKKILVLNEDMEQSLEERISYIHHIAKKCEEETQRQLLKMRDMREELLRYK